MFVSISEMDSSQLDDGLLLFSPDDSVLEQVKHDIGFENLSQEWDMYTSAVEHPMMEHQLSGLEVSYFSIICLF